MCSILSKELAVSAGVSQATVSRLLTGKGPVSDEKRKAIYEAADKLGVDLSSIRKTTSSIAFILKKQPISEQMVDNPFYSRVLHGAEDEATRSGFNLIYTTVEEDALSRGDIPVVVKKRNVDGLLVVGPFDNSAIDALGQMNIPLVQLDSCDSPSAPCVVTDNACGARAMANHLIFSVGPDIRCLSYDVNVSSFKEREVGFLSAFAERGLSVPERPIFHWRVDREQVDEAFAGGIPRAVFCVNDHLAVAVMRWAAENGVSVPEELCVAGFDNVSISEGVHPQLSTVHVHKEHMGVLGVLNLLRLIKGYSVPRVSLVSTELRMRGTTL